MLLDSERASLAWCRADHRLTSDVASDRIRDDRRSSRSLRRPSRSRIQRICIAHHPRIDGERKHRHRAKSEGCDPRRSTSDIVHELRGRTSEHLGGPTQSIAASVARVFVPRVRRRADVHAQRDLSGDDAADLPFDALEGLVRRERLLETRLWFAAFADGGEELAILKLDAVHRNVNV